MKQHGSLSAHYADTCGEIICPRQRFRPDGQTVRLHHGTRRERGACSSGAAERV
ncbi:MAG: hypothetical protein Q4F79_01550 [Eubacteriales bacterium]|nr:hypothetical protein [Eubacteriales bacterium]